MGAKGWGLLAVDDIKEGELVLEYLGAIQKESQMPFKNELLFCDKDFSQTSSPPAVVMTVWHQTGSAPLVCL
jgi:hypothetical protein